MTDLDTLLTRIRACDRCMPRLPLGPRPVLQASVHAKILVAGQAPGTKVHKTGIPFDDPSGDRLRAWMGVDRATFYDAQKINIIPMGFCYPGRMPNGNGDAPPDPECCATWHTPLFEVLPKQKVKLIIGRYALAWHLGVKASTPITDVIDVTRDDPDIFVLPHPSPRNRLWLKKRPWFEAEEIPKLQARIAEVLGEK